MFSASHTVALGRCQCWKTNTPRKRTTGLNFSPENKGCDYMGYILFWSEETWKHPPPPFRVNAILMITRVCYRIFMVSDVSQYERESDSKIFRCYCIHDFCLCDISNKFTVKNGWQEPPSKMLMLLRETSLATPLDHLQRDTQDVSNLYDFIWLMRPCLDNLTWITNIA